MEKERSCWYLYGDGTVQVSILYGVVYWLNGVRTIEPVDYTIQYTDLDCTITVEVPTVVVAGFTSWEERNKAKTTKAKLKARIARLNEKGDVPFHASPVANAFHYGNAGDDVYVSRCGNGFCIVCLWSTFCPCGRAAMGLFFSFFTRKQWDGGRGTYSVELAISFGAILFKLSNVFLISITKLSHLAREKSSLTTTRISLRPSL